MATLIGIDVGGTNLRVGVFSNLALIEETRFQANFSQFCKDHSPNEAWQKILNVTANAIQTVIAKYPDVETIGIGFPGFIDPSTQLIAQSPNLPGLINVNLAADLSQLIGKKVVVENDANAAAYGEYCLAGKPEGGLIYLGLGTGVGGGLIVDGKVYSGQHGCAMEVGHIIIEPNGRQCGCGNHGCVEQYASASGVAISYFNATQKQLSAYQIAELVGEGNKEAVAAYELAANALAQVLASILKVVDVQTVIIGGGMAGAWNVIEKAFNTRLEADLIPVLRGKVHVQISKTGDAAGMLGAFVSCMCE
jgi:glucokinase